MKNKRYYTVGTKWKIKNTTLSEQNEKQKILHCRNKMNNKKYYTVATKWKKKYYTIETKWKTKKYYACGTKWKTKNTILSEQNEK